MPPFLLSALLNWRVWAGLALGIACLTAYVQTHRLNAVKAEYEAFQTQVKAIGEAQERETARIIENQKRSNRESAKSYQSRLDLINSEYRRLRDANPGGREVPPRADAPAPTTDAARDAELLALLRAAEVQTGQLIELQEWVKAQIAPEKL